MIDRTRLLGNASSFFLDYWSNPQEEVAITAVAGDKALPDITISGIPAGVAPVRAVVMFMWGAKENTNVAANKLNGATVALTSQVIQVRDDSPSAYIDAINFVDDQFGLAISTREGGGVQIGSIDVKSIVKGNDTYNFRWLQALADLANLNFNDIQMGLRLWFGVG